MRAVNRVISAFFLTLIMLLITPNASANDTEGSASTLYTGTTYSYVCWDDACSYGVDRYDYYKFYLYYGDDAYLRFENNCEIDYVEVDVMVKYPSSWGSETRLQCDDSKTYNYNIYRTSNGYVYLRVEGIEDGLPIGGDDQAKIKIVLYIDSSERDRDYDGYDDDDDACKYDSGDSYQNLKGCEDSDNDGWADIEDDCPNDYSEYLDTDDDGYCDGDDEFPNDDTQWEDQDGDNYGDNSWGNQGDHFPNDSTQWFDSDNDNFGDNADGNNPDHCRFVYGNSYQDRNGCPDSDWDGYSNPDSEFLAHPLGTADAFKYDSSEWHDTDGDQYGDNSDQCANDAGTSAFKIYIQPQVFSEVGPLAMDVVIGDRWGGDANDLTDTIYPQMTITDLRDETDISHFTALPLGAGSNYYFETYFGCTDSDGDGFEDSTDQFKLDSTQWVDSDSDGFGDNSIHPTISDFNPSNCVDDIRDSVNEGSINHNIREAEFLICVSLGAENADWEAIENEQYTCDNGNKIAIDYVNDEDNDCGDNSDEGVDNLDTLFNPNSRYFHYQDYDVGWAIPGAFQSDACPLDAGTSTIDRFGCLDSDGDGYSDADDNWSIEDGADAWENNPTQWADSDGDGFGDNPNGTQGDACPDGDSTQSSTLDRYGCTDTDGDGYSDADAQWLAHPEGLADAFINDETQWHDADGDKHGDNINGTDYDHFTLDPTQWKDDDGDGYNKLESISNCGDDLNGNNPDLYPSDATQCTDTDGDGFGDNPNGTTMPDLFPLDATQWSDLDGDGYGDNGVGNKSDACISSFGTSTIDRYGCPDSNGDGYSDMNGFLSTVSSKAGNGDIGSILILAIIPLLLIIAITVRKISQKNKNNEQLDVDSSNFTMQNDNLWAENTPPQVETQSTDPNSFTNWVKEYDEHGNLYYYNTETQESKWEL